MTATVLVSPSPGTEKELRENNAESIRGNNIHIHCSKYQAGREERCKKEGWG